MTQLNKNSYQVYIIHVVVLGVIALPMMHLNIPAFVKYIVLTVVTFAVSNILVYFYRQLFQKTNAMKKATVTMVIAALLTITVYAKQANHVQSSSKEITQSTQIIGLHEAAIQGNVAVIREHIKAGADLDEKEPTGGSSPLITAIVFGKTEVAKVLIEAGANVNFRNNEGSTPLITATFFCRAEIVEALLANGADTAIKNNAGSTALESVTGPFEDVIGIYDYFVKAFGPMGLELDNEQIKTTRPVIAEILRNNISE